MATIFEGRLLKSLKVSQIGAGTPYTVPVGRFAIAYVQKIALSGAGQVSIGSAVFDSSGAANTLYPFNANGVNIFAQTNPILLTQGEQIITTAAATAEIAILEYENPNL